jgi:hypothetical protein
VAPSTFGSRAHRFYTTLQTPSVPRGVHVMNPYAEPATRRVVRAFLSRYFPDDVPRTLVIGINPGRFGAGITGVTFTDPVALEKFCGIPTGLPRVRELSSVFVYDFIERFGGTDAFYRRFFLTAASPLGFTRRGLNLNYYDEPALAKRVTPFIVESLRRQIRIGGRTDHAIVLGRGANFRFLSNLNARHGFFGTLHPLEHPRWILQYRRRHVEQHLAAWMDVFSAIP